MDHSHHIYLWPLLSPYILLIPIARCTHIWRIGFFTLSLSIYLINNAHYTLYHTHHPLRADLIIYIYHPISSDECITMGHFLLYYERMALTFKPTLHTMVVWSHIIIYTTSWYNTIILFSVCGVFFHWSAFKLYSSLIDSITFLLSIHPCIWEPILCCISLITLSFLVSAHRALSPTVLSSSVWWHS